MVQPPGPLKNPSIQLQHSITPAGGKIDTPKARDAPRGNILVSGVTAIPWTEVQSKRLCANCYATTHAAAACTVLCRKAMCHPPWLTRPFDGHTRKDCKAK